MRGDIAHWFAQHGAAVFPLRDNDKRPRAHCGQCRGDNTHDPADCPCIPNGGVCHGFHAATTNPETIATWWRRWPNANVGIATGASRLVVIDLDTKDEATPPENLPTGVVNGLDMFAVLCENAGQNMWPLETLAVSTPSGGMHVYYAAPEGSDHHSDRCGLGWGIDVRAAGGYVVAPGSHTSSGTYTRISDTAAAEPLPPWLNQLLAARPGSARNRIPQQPRKPYNPRAYAGKGGYVTSAVQSELHAVASIPAGEGNGWNDRLNRAAYALGQFVGAGALNEADVANALLDAALHSRPHREREARATIRSGLNSGQRRPRTIPGKGVAA